MAEAVGPASGGGQGRRPSGCGVLPARRFKSTEFARDIGRYRRPRWRVRHGRSLRRLAANLPIEEALLVVGRAGFPASGVGGQVMLTADGAKGVAVVVDAPDGSVGVALVLDEGPAGSE